MLIEAQNLTKQFGDFTAVNDLSLSIAQGEIVALLGPNGAGKTTTVRMLASILRPTSGTAQVCGYDVVTQAREVRHAVGLLTEVPGLYARMNAVEYLDFFGDLQHMPLALRRRRADDLLERFGLWEARARRLGAYSKGMKQKAAIARAMLHDPQILFLDEPTSAMDPYSAKQVRDAIVDLRRQGRTLLLCTHNLPEAELLADRIAIIRRGQIVASGTAPQLKRALLGDPLMEVRFASDAGGSAPDLGDLPVVAHGAGWLRYRTTRAATDNPQVLRRLAERGLDVVTLSEVERSLEDVYLKIVER